jgi:hypothetical protein
VTQCAVLLEAGGPVREVWARRERHMAHEIAALAG